LYWLDQFLKDITGDVNLTWWDWTSDISRTSGIPYAFAIQFVNGLPNPLSRARVFATTTNQLLQDADTIRSPTDPRELPTSELVVQALSLPDFEDFEFFWENYLHDNIHGWVGGSMAIAAWCAYDPLFWAHHCTVDRIWYLWQERNGNSSGLEDMFNEVLELFPLTVRQVLDLHQLGYDYALSSSGINV
jgi:tyrosinase